MKTESEKCAEVFRNGPGKFTFYCTLCTKQFEKHLDALDHIESHFDFPFDENSIKNDTEIEPENSQTEQIIIIPTEYIYNINIESIPNEENDTSETFVLQNEFRRPVSDTVPNESMYLDIIKVEPKQIKSKIETVQIKEHNVKYRRSFKSNKYKNFCKIDPTDVVECDICAKRTQRKSMVAHMRAHNNLKRLVCSICQERFHLNSALKKHMLVVHSSESWKKHCCQYCSQRFYNLSHLKQHIFIHTGEKPFKCEICGKACNQQSAMKSHMRSHTKEKPYPCEICNKHFSSSSSYWVHKRRHGNVKNHKCNTCEKAFIDRYELEVHKMTHTGERPFGCNVCNATFIKRFHYNQHLILHTNEKPYKCKFCDIYFAQMATRRLHERSIHNDMKRISFVSN